MATPTPAASSTSSKAKTEPNAAQGSKQSRQSSKRGSNKTLRGSSSAAPAYSATWRESLTPVLAIDPGPVESGWCVFGREWRLFGRDGVSKHWFGIKENTELLRQINNANFFRIPVVIERIASYGMPVGEDVFQTCFEIGRFDHDRTAHLVKRHDIKMELCKSAKAKDSNIAAAVRDQITEWTGVEQRKLKGTKANPGPLYGVKSHVWAALALAIYYHRTAYMRVPF